MIKNFNILSLTGFLLTAFLSTGLLAQNDTEIILKSRAMISAGKTSDAINLITRELEIKGSVRLYTERADAYISSGNLSAAIADFNEANKMAAHSGDYGLARAYALKGDISTSLYHLSAHLGSEYKRSEKEVLLEPAFSRFENRPEWRQLWKKEWYSFSENAVAEVEFLTTSGKTDDARSTVSELKSRAPGSPEQIYAEALVALASKKFGDAASLATKLSADNPGNQKYLRLLAQAQTGQLNFAGASVTYSKIMDAGEPDARLLILRAECFRKTMETGKALKDLEKFLEMYPEDKQALRLAGKVEAESGDNLKAIEYFTKNLKLHPDDQECYIDRANSYLAAKSWDWAVKDYSMSLDLKPENPDVWLNKGLALLGSGKITDACYDLRRAYSLGNQKAVPYISRHCLNK